ncbi:tail completion protein gp17 [Epibacterium ulvae]|uniref:tail completion protein gp17 n=1 Tax=Epibacterium ulvae TaxID=1156985 RepID=UPI00248F846A|nr:DUF3168 domain-containing protein [Epibacterium ulvae]
MEEYLYSLLNEALPCPVKWGYFSDGEAPPLVTMIFASGRRDHFIDGSGLMKGSIQIDCWAETYLGALEIRKSVQAALEVHIGGPLKSATLSAIRDASSSDPNLVHRTSLTFFVIYCE